MIYNGKSMEKKNLNKRLFFKVSSLFDLKSEVETDISHMIYIIEYGKKELVWCFYSEEFIGSDNDINSGNAYILEVINSLNAKVV